MELRAWAEAIVFGGSLEDKLLQPGSFRDQAPGAALERAPALPGRSAALGPSDDRLAPPPLHGLEDESARALVLHSFANHELQALELQALALLRFPDAPAAFREEIAKVLVEEQGHLRLYLERCRELGCEFGDAGLSRYLWDSLSGLQRPLDYVTGMALTFEQANLDYARDYEARFRAVGDEASAEILLRVYEEEIGHVQLGTQWLGTWAPGEDDWSAYQRLLPAGLTPRRARGTGTFQREARRQAGLSERFLAELALCGGSRGRPPDLLWFRPGAERALRPVRGPQTPPRSHVAVGADLSATLAFAARPDDLVVVPALPSLGWRQTLARHGLPQVEWVVQDRRREKVKSGRSRAAELTGAIRAALGERVLGRLRPWAWDPVAQEALAPLKEGLLPLDCGRLPLLASKPWAARLLDGLCADAPATETSACGGPRVSPAAWRALAVQDRGQTFADWSGLERAIESRGEARPWWVLKAALASSGEGLRRLAPGEGVDANLRGWAERALGGGPIRLEPWHQREADLSLVFEVGPAGCLGSPELTVFRTDEQGRYRGHWIGPGRRFLSPPTLRLLHEVRSDAGGARGLDLLEACAYRAAFALAGEGYRGPAGIDALIVKTSEGLLLHPLLELNARWTFGHLACALAKHLRRGRVGRWDLVQARTWERAGCARASDYLGLFPPAESAGEGLAAGVLPTNDPAQAQSVLGLLAVGRGAAEAGALLELSMDSPASSEIPRYV